MAKKTIFSIFITLVLLASAISFVTAADFDSHITGVSNRTMAINAFSNLVPTLLSIQCTNTSVDTYGSFHKCQNNNVSGAIGIGIDFRWQENTYGLAYLYNNSVAGNAYYNNLTVKKAAIVGVDDLVFGIDDSNATYNGSWEWSEYGGWKTGSQGRVATFFTGATYLQTWKILNSSIENFCFEEDSSDGVSGTGTATCRGINYTVAARATWRNDTTNLNTTYWEINGSSNQQHTHLIIGTDVGSWDLDNDTVIDGFVNMSFEVYDNFTGSIQIFFADEGGTYDYHACDINTGNTSTWVTKTCYYSHKGMPEESEPNMTAESFDYAARMHWRTALQGGKRVSQFRFTPTGSSIYVRNVRFDYNRESEYRRVALGVCNHINDDYSNPTTDILASNQWIGGAYTLFACAEKFNNATFNQSALDMLNITLAGRSDITGERDGVFREIKGFSGNYNSVSAQWLSKIANDYPHTQTLIDPYMQRYFNITSYLITGYNATQQETSFGTRTGNTKSIVDWAYQCGNPSVFYPNQTIVPKRLLQLVTNNSMIPDLSAQGAAHYTTLDGVNCVDVYKYWINYSSGAADLPQEDDTSRFFVYWNNSKIWNLKTANYTCWGTAGYDFPHAQIADCYDLSGTHFFSGKQNSIGAYTSTLINGTKLSSNDDTATLTIVNSSYPFSIRINGRVKDSTGFSKEDQHDNTGFVYNDTVNGTYYISLHEDSPNSKIFKYINLTSNLSTVSNPKIRIFGWANYGNSIVIQVNENPSCNYTMSFDNEWDWQSKSISAGCLVSGLNNVTVVSFSAGEQVRIAINATYDINYSASSNVVGSPVWNFSKVNPRGAAVQDGEYVIRLGYDTTESANTYTQTITFYDKHLESTITSDLNSNLNLSFLNTTTNSANIRGIEIVNKNNVTDKLFFIPHNNSGNFFVNNSAISGQLGNLNEISSQTQKTSFSYILQFTDSGFLTPYSRINNSQSSTTKNITVYDLTNSVITFSDGSTSQKSYGTNNLIISVSNSSYADISILTSQKAKLQGNSHIKINGAGSKFRIISI